MYRTPNIGPKDKTMMPEGLVLQASAPVRSHRRGFSDEVYMEAEA